MQINNEKLGPKQKIKIPDINHFSNTLLGDAIKNGVSQVSRCPVPKIVFGHLPTASY